MFVFLSSYPALLFKTKTQGFGGWCGRSKQGAGRERGLGSLCRSLGRSPTETQGEKAEGAEQSRALHECGKNSDSRCANRLRSPPAPGLAGRCLRGHSPLWWPAPPGPAPFPFGQRRRRWREPGGRVSGPWVREATLRLLLGRQPPSAEVSGCLLYRFIIASPRGDRNRGERGRERGRQRQGAKGSEKEAGGGKESFKLRREMEANF